MDISLRAKWATLFKYSFTLLYFVVTSVRDRKDDDFTLGG